MPSRIEQRQIALMKNPKHPYFVKYTIEHGRFSREEKLTDQQGLTQEIIVISCITNPDGSYSQDWLTVNGLTGESMHHQDVFTAWALMANNLKDKPDLSTEDREFCKGSLKYGAKQL